MTSLTIPNSVTSIGDLAFYGCSEKLISIIVEQGNKNYDSRNNCNAIIETASNCLLLGCKNSTIPNSVTSIGSYAFYSCSGLTSVTIPNSVTGIGNYAFYFCSGLTSVTIPKSVTYIGSGAFHITNLKYVIFENSTPPRGSYSYKTDYEFPKSVIIMVPVGSLNQYQNSIWNDYQLQYSLCKIEPFYTQAKLFSLNNNITKITSVEIDESQSYQCTLENDTIYISGLTPGTNYSTLIKSVTNNISIEENFSLSTRGIYVGNNLSSTQTSIIPSFSVGRDSGINLESATLNCQETTLVGKIEKMTNTYNVSFNKITGLVPNTQYTLILTLKINGKNNLWYYNIETKDITTNNEVIIGPTSAYIITSNEAGDAHIDEAYFDWESRHYKHLLATGLKPETNYNLTYYIVTSLGTLPKDMSFKTPLLEMTTQTVRMLASTSPMLMAETNIADVETSCGFEWRRYDAPEEMPSVQVYAPVFNGTMAGVLKNMSENVYYKYRPFYKANDGTMYYGDWIAFITADAGVEYEPILYSYKNPEVTQTEATLQGVALPGSSDITEQGFEYWRSTSGNNAPAAAPTGSVTKVKASGQRMRTTVEGLTAGATYCFRSYAVSGGKTYYGDEVKFATEKPAAGNGDVNGDGRVDVEDVNAVINIILKQKAVTDYDGIADVTSDGRVDVEDVNVIINIILKV